MIYQVYPRSFADSSGDGIGDLPGISARLPHISSLGVDALWLSPFYVSPQADAGYDIADYTDVDPVFGTIADFDRLLSEAHTAGLRVIVDLVPNHSSDEHPWFIEALASPAGSPARDRYIFRDGRGEHGDEPPNNWESVFGGAAWERVDDGQWYLHLFDVKQPDFNWANLEVVEFFDGVLRFWLDRGVDGFRVDVAHALVKDEFLPDIESWMADLKTGDSRGPMWDQEAVHDIYRHWHRVVSSYGDDRMLVAEAWVSPAARIARYVRADEMQQAFNFLYMLAGWDAGRLREAIDESIDANTAVGATTTWVLSNHDCIRHASRFGMSDPTHWSSGIGPNDEQPDAALGLNRARAATLLTLALPGSVYLYQGEELGLPEATQLPASVRQDPTFFRSGGAEIGRDGCRVPIPWEADAPALGFGPSSASWLPQPESFREHAMDVEERTPDSTLDLYRRAIRLRSQLSLGTGRLEWLPASASIVDFRNSDVLVITNFGSEPVNLPDGEVLIASSDSAVLNGRLAPNATVWLR